MDHIRPVRESEQRASLRFLLAKPQLSPAKLEAQITAFLAYLRAHELTVGPHLVAEQDGHLLTSTLAIQTGGRTAMVLVPNHRLFPRHRDLAVQLLIELRRLAPDHNLRLLQSLVDPDGGEDESIFADADFTYLATLLYMDADLDAAPPIHAQNDQPLTWTTYSPHTHALFAQTISATYTDSLDCRGLNGLRDIEDVIASHQASGEFDPNFWYVARQQQHPVGVLLLSRVPNKPAWEIVYMGRAPQARGKAVGQALIDKARQVARDQASKILTLAVDDQNRPALKLYHDNGFRSSGRRRAWIATVNLHKPAT